MKYSKSINWICLLAIFSLLGCSKIGSCALRRIIPINKGIKEAPNTLCKIGKIKDYSYIKLNNLESIIDDADLKIYLEIEFVKDAVDRIIELSSKMPRNSLSESQRKMIYDQQVYENILNLIRHNNVVCKYDDKSGILKLLFDENGKIEIIDIYKLIRIVPFYWTLKAKEKKPT